MGFKSCVLLALVAGAVAGPINVEDGNQKCARTCTESLSENAKFQYAVGTTYQFSYAGEAVTQVEGSGSDRSALKISATADVEVLSQCEFSLKLRDVRLLENGQSSSSSASFGQRLEANAVRFSFQDGRIESVCPDATEDDRVLNLKKGVLSAFQNSLLTMESSSTVEEEDVTGTCKADYLVARGVLGGYTIKKSKDLLSCTNRNGNISSLQSETYRVPSSVQSLPLMRSTHNCEQKISSGVLQSTVCKEEHVFRPFSKHNSGAKTVVDSSLKFDRTRLGVSTRLEPVQRRTSLLFQHIYDSGADASSRDNVVTILTTLCDQVKVGLRPETPEDFGRLVQAMKKLSLESMVEVRNRLTNGHVCSSGRATKFFLDAVPLVGTAASIAFTRDLIKDGTISGAEVDVWLTHLGFVQQPTVQMLAEIKPLLEDANLRSKAVLGVSSLVHKVCSSMAACQRHPDVAAVVRVIEEMLGSNCNVNDAEDRTRVMYALKAIGNAGRAVTSSSIISSCAQNANLDVDIRVAALQAFRRLPCSVDHEAAMRLFQNADEDAELRINAYLAVMSCPSSESLLKVKMALSGEVVNQVGSFVWTHLTNLQETASVFKQDIRNILQDAKLREDYDCDARKYSHNFEKSFFSEYLNMGGQVESNVIFSQKSYVPRSAMLNLTVDMFGNSINLLEVGGRVQGLETILEKFFGKNGYFSQSNVKSLMRNKRDVNLNIASIFDKIFKIRDDKLRGGLYLKALGNELFYKELTQEVFTQGNVNFLDLLMKLAEPTDMELTHSSMFLDATLVVPTMIGMPLNLTVNGTAMLNLQIGGKADIRKAAVSPRSLDISGHIKPSAAIVISGAMSVHGLTAQSTLRMVSTMHTSTALEGKLQLQDGEVLNAELKVPRDKMEIVSVESKILINGVELQTPTDGRTEVKKCSSPWLSKVIGMELCAEASIPPLAREGSAYFPLTGPLSAKVVLNQKDKTALYNFEARYESPRIRQDGVDYVKRLARLSFDTPGSTVDRKMVLEFNFDQQKMAAGFSFITPWKKLSADSELVNLESIKKATVRLTIDGEKYYSGLAEMSVDARKNRVVYSPRIEINIPGREAMTAAGTLELNNNWPVRVDVTIDKFTGQAIRLTGTMSKPGESITGSASISTQWASVKVEGGIDNKKGLQGARLAAEYSLAPGSNTVHRMSMAAKLQNRSSGDLLNYAGSLGFTATAFPWLEFSITGNHQMSMDSSESILDAVHGSDRKTLNVKHVMSKSGSLREAFEGSMQTSISYAQVLDVASSIKHKHSANEISSSAEVTYGSSRTARISWNLANKLQDNGALGGSLAIQCPAVQLQVNTELSKLADGEYSHTFKVEAGNLKPFDMTNLYKVSPAGDYQLSGSMNVPSVTGAFSYSSHIRMKADDFAAKAELSKAADTYSVEATYRMLGRLSASGAARLLIPAHESNARFEFDVSGAHKTATVELKTTTGAGKPMQVALVGEYNNVDTEALVSRDSLVTLTLPGTRVQVSANVRKADSNAAGVLELELNDKKSHLSMEYDLAATARAKLHLVSPYIRYGGVADIDLELIHSGDATAFTNYVSVGWAPEQKITIDTKLDSRAISWSSDVKTPFTPLRSFGSSLSFNTDVSDLRVQGKGYVNEKEVSSVVSLRGTESGSLTVVLPDRTTLSGAFEHKFAGGKLKNKVELNWGRRQQLILDTNIGFQPDIVGTVSLSTPFAALRSAVISVDHQGKSLDSFASTVSVTWDGKQVQGQAKNGNGQASASISTPWKTLSADCTYAQGSEALSARGSFTWSVDKTVAWSANLDRSAGISASVGLSSPFEHLRSIEARLTHTGSALNFETSAEVVWEQTSKIAVRGKLNTNPSIEGSFSVATPFAVMPSAKVAFSHSGSQLSFNNQATLEYSHYEQMRFESKYNQASGGSMTLRGIPSDELKSLDLGYAYTFKGQKTSATATVTWNGSQKMSLSAEKARSRQNTQTASFSLTTPFSALTAAAGKVTHSGSVSAFTNQAELSWGEGRKVTAVTEFNKQTSSAKLDVSSPYGGLKLLHSGGIRQFTSSASLMAPDSRVLASLQAEMSSQTGIYGKIAVVTPLEKAKSLSATFTHKGQWSDFENSAEISWAEGVSASTNARFKFGDVVSGEFRAVCPWAECSLKVNHEGSIRQFRNSAEVSWGKRDNFAVTTSFSSTDAISGEIALTSTIKDMETAKLMFEHTGAWSKFNNRGKLAWANHGEVSFNSRLDVSSTVSGELELSSPVANAKFSHSGNLKSFDNNAEIRWANNKKVAFSSSFSTINDVTLAATFSSPFKHVEDLNMKASHRRDTETTFTDYAEFSWAAGKKMSLDTRVERSSILTATATFSHPSISVGAFLNHSGNLRSFNSNAGLSWAADKKVEASIEFSNGASMTGKAALSSPFARLRNVDASFNYKNRQDGFEAEASTTWSPSQKVSSRFVFATVPDLNVNFTLQSPWTSVSADARHSGGWSNFENNAEFSWGSDKKLVYSSRFSRTSDIVLSARLSSPFRGLESLSMSAQHQRIAHKFTTYGEFSWAEGQNVRLETAIDLDSGVAVTSKFASPFKNVEMSLSHSGDLQSFNCRADLAWSNDKRMTGTMEFQNGATISGKATFESPFDVLRNAEVSFRHQKLVNGFETNGNMMWSPSERMTTRVTFQGLPDMRMTAAFNSPFANINTSAEHKGTWQEFSNKAEVSWSADKKIAVSSRFVKAPEVSMVATFSSPFDMLESVSFSALHRGQLSGTFSNEAEFSWATGKKMSLTTSVDRSSGVKASTRYASPFQNIDASLNHEGTLSFFKSKAEIGWGSSKRIAATLDFDNRSTISVDAKFTSPFEAVKSLNARFNHMKLGNGFETDASVTLEQQTVSGRVTFQGLPDMRMTAAFISPFANINTSAEHSGTWQSFSNKAEVSWSADKKIAVSSRFVKAPEVSMVATFSSPFDMLESVSFTASHSGELTGTYSNTAEFSWAAGKKMSLETSADRSSGVRASARFASPFQNVDASLSHVGDVREFQSEASLGWSQNKAIKVTAQFSQSSDVSGKLTFSSPFRHFEDIKAEFSHNGDLTTGFNCRASLDFAPGKTIAATLLYTGGSEYKYLAMLNTPFGHLRTLTVSMNVRQTESSFDNTVELKWNSNAFKVVSSCARTDGNLSGQVEVTANDAVYRVTVTGSKGDGSIQASIAVVTPFASYEESKLEGAASLKDNRLALSLEGQLGRSGTRSRANLVVESVASGGRVSLEVSSQLLAERAQRVELSYRSSTNEATVTADLDAAQTAAKLSVVATRSASSQGQQSGSLVVGYEWNGVKDTARFQGSYGRVRSQYRSTFSAQRDSKPDSKLSWASTMSIPAKGVDIDVSLKTPFEVASDAKFTFKLTGDSREFSVSTSARLRADSPAEFTLQFSRRGGVRINAEVKSPFEVLRSAAASIRAQQSSPAESTLSVAATYNGQESKLDGSVKANGNDDFEGSLEFTSPIETIRSIKMQVNCKKADGVLRPYATLSWAADKRIDVSASFRHDSNSREATLDISTPFAGMSTVHTEFTHVAHLPDTMNSRFEFKTSAMAEKLSASISYDRPAGSASLLLSSPWQPIRNLQLTASSANAKVLRLDINGDTLASINASWNFSSIRNHNGEVTMDIPVLSKYLRVKIDNVLESEAAEKKSSVELEYSRGKIISLNYSNRQRNGLISLTFDSPFPSANFGYNLKYTGSRLDEWTEETKFTSSILQFTSSSQLKMQGGLQAQHSCKLTYDGQTYTTSKTFTATGDLNRFSASFTCRSSYMPALDVELTYAASPVAVKATVNGFAYEVAANGSQASMKAEFPFRNKKESVAAMADWKTQGDVKITLTTPFQMLRNLEVSLSANGALFVSSMTYNGLKALTYQGTFGRSDSSLVTQGEVIVDDRKPISWNGKLLLAEGSQEVQWSSSVFGVNVNANIKPFEGRVEMRNVQGAGASVELSNALNADGERVPVLIVTTYDANGSNKSYEVRGLYKNVGSGVVRDFKLHLQTPRGLGQALDLKFEFSIKSNQFVPGDAIVHLFVTKPDGTIQQLVQLNAEWGNNGIVAVIRDPWPMKYEMKFNVNTKRQAAEIIANWNTARDDSTIRIDFSRAGTMNSQMLQEATEARIIYGGSSYAVTSELDWQRMAASHKLKLDIADKVFGYEAKMSKLAGQPCVANVKIITPLRSVLLESSTELDVTKRLGLTAYLSWDADRDVSKKVGGEHVIRWESNKLWMETTFHHPAMSKDVRVVDEIVYNTDGVIGSFKKTIDYSQDERKKIVLIARLTTEEAAFVLTQPYNNINVDITGNLRASQEVYGAGGKLVYMTSDGSNNVFELAGSLDVKAMVANMKATSPAGTTTVRGELMNRSAADGKAYTVIVRGNSGNSSPITATVDLSEKALTASMKVDYDAGQLALSAGKFNATAYSIEMSHLENGVRHVDGIAAASLNPDNIVNGRLYWNPENYVAIKSKVERIRRYLKDSVKTLAEGISTELNSRKSLRDADLNAVAEYSRREMELIQSDAAIVSSRLNELYVKDALYVRTIGESVSQTAARVQGKVTMLKEKYGNMATAVTTMYTTEVAPIIDLLGSDVSGYWQQIQAELADIEKILSQVADAVGSQFIEKSLAVSEKAARIGRVLKHYIDSAASEASKHDSLGLVRDFHSRAMTAFNTYSDAAASRVSDVTAAIGSRIAIQPEQASRVFGDAYDFANARSAGYLEGMLDRETFAGFGGAGVDRIKGIYRNLNIERHVSQFVAHSKELAREYLNTIVASGIDKTIDGSKWFSYDPETGSYQFDLRIPSVQTGVSVDDVKVAVRNRLNNAVAVVSSYMPALNMPAIRLRVPSLTEILPPYDAYATISGQHIQTFDRRHYDFVGSCSYLLARDFEDGNFSLTIKYDGQGAFSLSAIDDGKTIDLMGDGSVRVEGGKVELPIERINMTVTKEDEKVKLVNARGVAVTCHWSAGYCTVQMSGWYFAKTAGLLGTYNNEGSDDFMTSDNRNVSDVLEFTNSWKLSSSCQNVNSASAVVNIPTICSSVFESSSSPLSPCFSVIDPSMYTHMCADAAAQNRRNPHCSAIQLYKDICSREGVQIYAPSECTSCMMPNKVVRNGESARITNTPSTADVIFVVEERDCNDYLSSKMQFLVAEMEDALSKKGMRDNRYGIVGFGGEGVHERPHTQTFDGQTMTAVDRFRQGADSLQFSANAEEQDSLSAIRYAASYRFRAGAAKVIVLLSCSNCSKGNEEYAEVHDLLRSMDITFHAVMEHNFDLVNQEKKAQTSALFGVDHASVYTMRDAKTFKGDKTLYSSVRFPSNQCFTLALQSKGSYFDLRMLKEKPQVAKNFQKVLALRVAASAEPGDCQVCTCRADDVRGPRAVCSQC